MKKFVSLLLAAVMMLSLSTTAFAGSAADTAVLRLTGDAADEVVNLKDGQHVSTGQDVAVRLNVQSDPGAAEYTVALDGETVEADHSTSQYHFYYLPAGQLADVSTLSVSTQALESGTGTEADPYQIATAADLKAFRDKVNNGSTGLCAVLTADIALDKSETWTPIGTSNSNRYAGTFDGAGHTISGISIPEGTSESGLFGCTAKSVSAPVIKNLTIADSTIVTTGYAGAFAAWGGGVFENCHTAGDVTVQGKKYAGGIVGYYMGQYAADELTMTQCSNRASVTETQGFGGYAGGLIGDVVAKLTLTNSFNAGAVTSIPGSQMRGAGGLVGQSEAEATLTNVYNVGEISVNNAGNAVGGLIGTSSKAVVITNAYQHGSVANKDGSGAAIIGMVNTASTLKNVYKTGTLADKLAGSASFTGKATAVSEEKLKTCASNLGGEFTSDLSGDAAVNNGFPILLWQNPVSSAADVLAVTIGSEESKVMLDGTSTDPAAPVEKTVSIGYENLNAYVADRIYLNGAADNSGTVELGLTLSADGELGETLTKQNDGYTADTLYFYRTPAVVERTVYAVHTIDGAKHYYKIILQRTADTRSMYGAVSADWRDDNPVLTTVYNAESGYLTANVKVRDYFAQYKNGVLDSEKKADALYCYKPDFKYYAYNASAVDSEGYQKVDFARVGRYWMTMYCSTLAYNSVPGAVWWGSQEVADKYIAAANALKQQEGYAALPAALRTAFENAVKAVSDGWNEDTAKRLYLNAAGGMTTEKTGFIARDAMGAPMTGEYELEQKENLMLDYMDVVKAYLADSDLGTIKYQALSTVQKSLGTGKLAVVKIMDIKSDSDKQSYETYRRYVWQIINASDIVGVNEGLTKLGLGKLKLDVVSEKAQVIVGDKTYDLELTGGGSTASTAKTVTVTAERSDGGMQRIYLTRTENMTPDSSMEGILGKGYTKSSLYFYDTPAEQVQNISVSVTEGETTAYYTIKVVLPAKSGTALGPNGMGYKEDTPGGMNSFSADTGYIYGTVQSGPMIFGGMKLYTDGKSSGDSIAPDWAALETSTNKLYYLSNDTQANFARPGCYWIPVSDGTNESLLPMRASITESNIASILTAADTAAATEGVSAEAKAMLEGAASSIKNRSMAFSASLYLNADGSLPADGKQRTGIQVRSYFGALLYGDSLYEKETNIVLDLTAICTTWGTDADLAAQQFEAYQRILNMNGGV